MTHASTTSLRQQLNDLVGVEYVREGTALDAIDGLTPTLVVEPASEQEIAAVLARCSEHGLAVAPRGGGTKLGWGNPPRALDIVLSLERLDNLVEHAHGDMTATIQAGMRFADVQTALAQNGQMLALDVEHPEHATIGGIVATNDSGALRVRYGGVRDQIIGITVVRSDGVVAHGGGRVVKNVAGYDLPKLYTGSLGSLGIITQATFRLYPLPAETRSLTVDVGSASAGGQLMLDMLSSTLMPTGLTLRRDVDGTVSVTAQFSGILESVESQLETAQSMVSARGLPLPLGEGWGEGRTTSFAAGGGPSPQPSPRGSGSSGMPSLPGLVLKVSVLPTEIAATIDRAVEIGTANSWITDAVIHAHGLGRVAWITHGQDDLLTDAIELFRESLAPREGTAVVIDAPLAVKRQVDVWGPVADTLPVMRRVKEELDPRGTLNPGRLIGGL